MAAAAETSGSTIDSSAGNLRMRTADLTSVDDTDTWDSTLNTIVFWTFVPATAVAVGGTVSGGTITIKVASGTLVGKITAWGT